MNRVYDRKICEVFTKTLSFSETDIPSIVCVPDNVILVVVATLQDNFGFVVLTYFSADDKLLNNLFDIMLLYNL